MCVCGCFNACVVPGLWFTVGTCHTWLHGGRGLQANQRANYRISFPLRLLSTVSLFYSMRAFIVGMGERSTAVISVLLWRGVYQGEGPREAKTAPCVLAHTLYPSENTHSYVLQKTKSFKRCPQMLMIRFLWWTWIYNTKSRIKATCHTLLSHIIILIYWICIANHTTCIECGMSHVQENSHLKNAHIAVYSDTHMSVN